MTAKAGSSFEKERSCEGINTCAPDKGAETERAGATTAGSVGLTLQQSLWTVALDSTIEAQQSCPVLCACCRQISAGAAKVPIKTMATAARWKTPCNMVTAYYGGWISR
jgi:hypothetical protein